MPKHVLGIEVTSNRLTAVQLTGTSKSYSVTAAVHHPLPQSIEPEEQAILQRQAVQEAVEIYGLRADTILTTLPSHKTILRNLTLPFKDSRRIRQTLKGVLEEHMPFRRLPRLKTTFAKAQISLAPSRPAAISPLWCPI